MSQPWDFLDDYRNGKLDAVDVSGEWPTLPELFDITVDRYSERRAFTTFDPEEITLSYRDVQRRVRAAAAYLQSLGVRAGDRVAVTGKNSPEWAVAYLAVLYAGGVVVPLDYQLHSPDIAGLMGRAEVKAVFVDTEKYDDLDTRGREAKIALSPDRPNYIFSLPQDRQAQRPSTSEHDLAAILFTSGTTGSAKGVMLTHRNITSDALLAQANLNIRHDDVFYALLPLHHSYTMLAVFIEAISVGAEVVFAKRMIIKQILADLKRGQVTMLLGIPMLFNKLLKGILRGVREKGALVYGIIRLLMGISGIIKHATGRNIGKKLFHSVLEKASLDTIRICISGGGPLPPATFRKFNQLGIDFVQGYGLTETSPIITLNPVEHYKEESVGKVLPQTDMKIYEPDERGIGEIVVKGPMVMKGYYNDEEATRETFTEDGYFRTGDMGRLDRENYLYLTGRKKSLIVTAGGKNVYPEEIEDHFQLYDEIEQIMVKGYISNEELREEDVEAYVYPDLDYFGDQQGTQSEPTEAAPGQSTEPDWEAIERRANAIVEEVNKELMPYQRIKRVTVLREPMEMTTTKKIKRHKVS
ncbi:MAG: AMP-dependent synthetase/ligase [Spirochaetaceae bacterium]